MEFKEIVKERYATKKFDGKEIPEDKINELLEIIRMAASSFGLQPWRIKVIKDQGLIEHIGVSNFSLQQLKEALEIIKVVSVENHYNLAFKIDEQDLLPYLTDQNITYLPYFPLGAGKLLQNPELNQIAQQLKITTSQLALSWITTKWPTAIPIPGTSNKHHLLENIKAADIKLQNDIIEKLDKLY